MAYINPATKKFPNQWTIDNVSETPKANKGGRTWLTVYNDDLSEAMQTLGANGLKLYLYLAALKTDKKKWNLSIEAAMKATGLSRSSVQRGKKELVDNGYLVCCGEDFYKFNTSPMRRAEPDPETAPAPEVAQKPQATVPPQIEASSVELHIVTNDEGITKIMTYAEVLAEADNNKQIADYVWQNTRRI